MKNLFFLLIQSAIFCKNWPEAKYIYKSYKSKCHKEPDTPDLSNLKKKFGEGICHLPLW